MAGITQGDPKVSVGEPIRLGDNNEYEVRHDPITDRLEITDTVNGETAFVRPETSGQMQGNGLFIRSLIDGKPLADDGRLHDSIQDAERAASSYVFIPPGTFNGSVTIETQGLTLMGAGNSSVLTSLTLTVKNISVENLKLDASQQGISASDSENSLIKNVTVLGGNDECIRIGDNSTVTNCRTENGTHGVIVDGEGCVVNNNIIDTPTDFQGVVTFSGGDTIISYNVVVNAGTQCINIANSNNVVVGNRLINSNNDGIFISGSDHIIANNRISDSGDDSINDDGTNTLLDGNLTVPAN
jgi:hypothetical protein